MLAALSVVAHGQDPTPHAPKNCQLVLADDLVRVVRLHYGAHEKIPSDFLRVELKTLPIGRPGSSGCFVDHDRNATKVALESANVEIERLVSTHLLRIEFRKKI